MPNAFIFYFIICYSEGFFFLFKSYQKEQVFVFFLCWPELNQKSAVKQGCNLYTCSTEIHYEKV